MKEFKELNSFKNLKFQSVIPQDILQAVELLEKLGYKAEEYFSADDAARHNGVCAWDDGEITEGWLYDDNFEQVTLEELKEMVGETSRCNNNLSNNFTVTWEQVFGEKFVDSVSKAMKQNTDIVSKTVKQNKNNTMKNDIFKLERLLGCEVLVKTNLNGFKAYVVDHVIAGNALHVKSGKYHHFVNISDLTFFTEDGDELKFDEYVKLYYGDNCV